MRRHLQEYRIPVELFIKVFTTNTFVLCDSGVPEDARFYGASLDYETQVVKVIFEHPSFPESFPGSVVPHERLLFRIFEQRFTLNV